MKKTALSLLTIFTLTSTGMAFAGGTVAPAPAESQAAPPPSNFVAPAPVPAPAPNVFVRPAEPYQGWWVPLVAIALVAVAAGGQHSTTP